MLFSRYGGGAETVLRMGFEEGLELLQEAEKKQHEEKIFQRWIHGYQETMSFTEFRKKASTVTRYGTEHSEEEILEKVKRIIEGEEGNDGTF